MINMTDGEIAVGYAGLGLFFGGMIGLLNSVVPLVIGITFLAVAIVRHHSRQKAERPEGWRPDDMGQRPVEGMLSERERFEARMAEQARRAAEIRAKFDEESDG